MNEETVNWLNFLQNRLNAYETKINQLITITATALLTLSGFLISLILKTEEKGTQLTMIFLFVIGITMIVSEVMEILNKYREDKNQIIILIKNILNGKITTFEVIEKKWDHISLKSEKTGSMKT